MGRLQSAMGLFCGGAGGQSAHRGEGGKKAISEWGESWKGKR